MNKIPFEDGTKTQEAYVAMNGQNYPVTPAVWSGTTPVSAFNLNNMQNNIENAINGVDEKYEEQTTIQRTSVTLESMVNANTNYNLPTGMYYKVGNNSLEVIYCSTKLQKGQDYNEIGNIGDTSNIIQFTDSIGDLDMSEVEGFENFEETLEFIVRGDYNDN